MGKNLVSILKIDVSTLSKKVILEKIEKYIFGIKNYELGIKNLEKNPLVIFTPNPEIITYAQHDKIFKEIVNSAQINIPDGVGVVWAMERLYRVKIERIPGVDFVENLCQKAAVWGVRIGTIGTSPQIALAAAERLRRKYPGLKIEHIDSPDIRIKNEELRMKNKNIHGSYFQILNSQNQLILPEKYFESLVKRIEQKQIGILLVALGFPKQEYFIESIKYRVSSMKYKKPLVLMAVGGALDYISGVIPRAPMWMRENGLEWLYRLIKEPRRLGRQLKGTEFFVKVLKSS